MANTNSFNPPGNTPLIGTNEFAPGTSNNYIGYMQDLRIYKGVAKYKTNFIPPGPMIP